MKRLVVKFPWYYSYGITDNCNTCLGWGRYGLLIENGTAKLQVRSSHRLGKLFD